MSEKNIYHFGEKWKRTCMCGEVGTEQEGAEVRLAGWVKKVREFGDLTFMDLWDRTGLVQVVAEEADPELNSFLRSLRAEDVIAVSGVVRKRPEDMINSTMKTGEVEVRIQEAQLFNKSEVPPFNVTDKGKANDDLRLKFRYLDLRRDSMQHNLQFRHDLVLAVRNFLSSKGFLEIETPMLVRRTPEGARDYLVPSRLQPGRFYALPQSPQLYKQLLMVSGFDRYFQLARCLRDEDLRADRQPEHTQIDIEMSFVSEEEIFEVAEKLMKEIFAQVAGVELEIPFERIEYDEAMLKYGTDKPDLRFGLEISDCTKLFESSNFQAFSKVVSEGGVVRGIAFREGNGFSNSQVKKLEKAAREAGAGGLAWIKVNDEGMTSPISKFLGEQEIDRLLEHFGFPSGSPVLLLLVAGPELIVARSLGALRSQLGSELFDCDDRMYRFLWVNRFPLFTRGEDGGWEPAHHIFSMPLQDDIEYLEKDPGRVRGHLYDLVCNGVELGSGSIRIHRRELQESLFRVIGIDQKSAERKFGFLLDAFEYGAPPHGGIAVGVDRLAMIIKGESSIRDFIAFPKTQSATSLMEGAPSEVEEGLLDELHIQVISRKNKE